MDFLANFQISLCSGIKFYTVKIRELHIAAWKLCDVGRQNWNIVANDG